MSFLSELNNIKPLLKIQNSLNENLSKESQPQSPLGQTYISRIYPHLKLNKLTEKQIITIFT